MTKKSKLELTWPGKEDRPKLEPRILIENPAKSYHAAARRSDSDIYDNMLIKGDNLLALKALEADYTSKVKCIYIDPPYNTGNAFDHYDDGLEHSVWLSLLRDRLVILRRLLDEDGILICHIDDQESHYLKLMLDEIFGRSNYLSTFYIQVRYGNKTLAEDNAFQKVIEQCFVYSKDRNLARPIKNKEPYKTEKFEWKITELSSGTRFEVGGKKVDLFKPGEYLIEKVEPSETGLKETWATGSLVRQSGSSGEFLDKYLVPRKGADGLSCLYKVHGIGEDGLGFRYMTGPKKADATKGKFFSGIPLQTLEKLRAGDADKDQPINNFYDFAGSFGNCRHEGGVEFRGGKKPEVLIQTILKHFSRPGDLVLDSFAGSGTTAAVAHKMGRRWITIEIGEHADTHVLPRMQKVVAGSDQVGISKSVDWKGGGGFRYFTLAPSLLSQDKYGNWVIATDYNPEMLAEAMCKHMGFTYAPSAEDYWRHGASTETDFIYVTTQSLTHEACAKIAQDVGSDRSLLICCKAYSAEAEAFENLTLVKIPTAILQKCEWGRDDYSLNIAKLPMIENGGAPAANDLPLFSGDAGDE
jgi:adenine-specific DNA-methyltransferase